MAVKEFLEENFSGPHRRKMEREELSIRKKLADAALIQQGYDPKTLEIIPNSAADVERAQNQMLMQSTKALEGKLAALDSDKALEDFAHTGDATYLQNALTNNPVLKKAWGDRGVQAVANIDWINDADLLARTGFHSAEYDTPEKQSILKKNIYKYYDGTDWNIGLLNNVIKETGTMKRLGNRSAQVFLDNYEEMRNFMSGPRSSAWTAEGHKYEKEITKASEATGVPPNLIAAMIQVESSGNPNAKSHKGASGLMQLMPDTAAELGVKDVNDPAENIMAGATYMAKMLERFNGDTRLALAAYNAGPGNVKKYNGVPPFEETQKYVSKILGNFANAESYYDAGQGVIDESRGMLQQTDPREGIDRESRYADNRIATIQNFVRGNANAARGTTNENVDADAEVARRVSESQAASQRMNALTNQAELSIKEEANRIRDEANMIELIKNRTKLSTEGVTTTQKDLAAAEQITNSLLEDFGGEEQFFATDFSKPENFNKAWQKVVKINKLEGTEYTNEEKKEIRELRGLIALADPISKLGSAETGMIDSRLKDVKKLLFNEVGGAAATSAYNAFKNSMRHALYGSALTPGEIASFDAAFGKLGQKAGPVLEQFKTALTQVQTRLDSVSSLGNPYTTKVMLGADREKLQKIADALQARIDYFTGKTSGEKKKDRPPLSTFFQGNK